ncbi:MAG: AAA family ATPase [Clostridiales bacterium]|nr:AAA family ATPase [Clostridiales bacterium]
MTQFDPAENPVGYLMDIGFTAEQIQQKLGQDIPAAELAQAVSGIIARGEDPLEGLERMDEQPDISPQSAPADPKPRLTLAADVPYEPPRWLLAPYFQRGKGTLIQGDNGSGKTAFMCAIAAHVSTGEPLLGLAVETPGNVLMISVEDDLPVLRGRIEACGGDLAHCYFLSNAAGLTFNSPEIEAAVREIAARLIIFDPIQAFMGAGIDMFRSNETRPALAKLFEMCDRNDCACAIVAHTSKSSGDKSPVNRSLGSVDIPAAMRSILQLIRNPDNEDECVMVHIKCSNAPKGRSLAYGIGDRGGVQWHGYSPMTADDLTTIVKRKEKGVPYENEPLVQVFNQLVTDRPGGGFWSYADLKEQGAKILGFPPFRDLNDLRTKLDNGLARELQEKDGLIVTHSAKGHGNVRGVKIERYVIPQGYQQKLQNEAG